MIVPSICYTNSNLIFEKALASGGEAPWPPPRGSAPCIPAGGTTPDPLLTVPLLNSLQRPW